MLDLKECRIKELKEHLRRMEDYLMMKFHEQDWHGVQDAASDIRDIESELKGLRYGE